MACVFNAQIELINLLPIQFCCLNLAALISHEQSHLTPLSIIMTIFLQFYGTQKNDPSKNYLGRVISRVARFCFFAKSRVIQIYAIKIGPLFTAESGIMRSFHRNSSFT